MTDRDLLPVVTRLDGDWALGDRQLIVVLVEARLPEPRRLRPVTIEQRAPAPRRSPRRRLLLLSALAAMLPAGALAWFAAGTGMSNKPRNSVDVPIPSGIEIDLAALPPPPRAEAKPVPPAPAAPIVVAKEAKPSPPKLLTIDRFPQVQAAIRAAFASGVAQPWAANGIKGFAIVGPVQIDGNHACRNVAVWVKNSAEGQTLSARRCMAENGAWIGIGEPKLIVEPPIG